MKIDELTRLAFVWAEQDRAALADAWPKGSPERKKAASQADELRRYRLKRWGNTRLENLLDRATSKSIGNA
jgi:hypothetical protein